MKRLLLVNLIFLVVVTISCKTTDKNSAPDSFGKDTKKLPIQNIIKDSEFNVENALKDVVIQNAVLTDSILNISLSYEGCKDDNLELVFTGNYLKTYPPKAQVYLRRVPGSQGCGKKMNQVYLFNVAPIKYGNGKTLIISLKDYNNVITYQY